jgi:hypothetical protein
VLSRGPAAIGLKAYGVEAHMVVAELGEEGSALIRDPALGASYIQPFETIEQFWNGLAVYR